MLKVTEVLEAKVSVTVQKTGKTYYRTMNYAKHITAGPLGKPEEAVHEYFLREGRGWKQVTEGEFMIATCKEAVVELEDKLTQELRERVEKIMAKE